MAKGLKVGDRIKVTPDLYWKGGRPWIGQTGTVVALAAPGNPGTVTVKFDDDYMEGQASANRTTNTWWVRDLDLIEPIVTPEEIETAIQSITGGAPLDLADALRRRLQDYDEILAMPDQDDAIATIDLVDDLRRMLRQTKTE